MTYKAVMLKVTKGNWDCILVHVNIRWFFISLDYKFWKVSQLLFSTLNLFITLACLLCVWYHLPANQINRRPKMLIHGCPDIHNPHHSCWLTICTDSLIRTFKVWISEFTSVSVALIVEPVPLTIPHYMIHPPYCLTVCTNVIIGSTDNETPVYLIFYFSKSFPLCEVSKGRRIKSLRQFQIRFT